MKVQLLLLLSALVGPFLTFTHASPTAHPTGPNVEVHIETTEIQGITVVTGPPEKQPSMAPGALPTEATTAPVQPHYQTDSAETMTVPMMVQTTPDGTTLAEATVADSIVKTVEHLVTDHPVVETAAPATAAGDVKPVQTAAAEAKPNDAVVIEEGADEVNEGLTSGQVAGIVIGALLAVVIVIAVVIAVVRRMGKYSP